MQKQKGQKVYKTMQGKQIDMDLLRKRNELTPAVGNVRANARGDELGAGGEIIRKKEDVLKDYYENAKGVPNTTVKKQTQDDVVEKDLVDDWEEPETTDDWIEDDQGNFVKKGE